MKDVCPRREPPLERLGAKRDVGREPYDGREPKLGRAPPYPPDDGLEKFPPREELDGRELYIEKILNRKYTELYILLKDSSPYNFFRLT